MSRLICVSCARPLRCAEVGVPIEETFNSTGEPYKLWMTDIYKCDECGAKIAVIQAKQEPLAEHFQTDYAQTRARYVPRITVPV